MERDKKYTRDEESLRKLTKTCTNKWSSRIDFAFTR